MDSTITEILHWLDTHEGPFVYIALGMAAMVEYIFPPFPGDTITLFGVFLARAARYKAGLTYFAITVGSTIGSVVAYGIGYALRRFPREKMPKLLAKHLYGSSFGSFRDHFNRHGNWLLIANRFIPAFRGVVFILAGMTSVSLWRVIFWGTISAALWNALLFLIGNTIAQNWRELSSLIRTYSYAAIVVGILVGIFIWTRSRSRKK